MNKWFTMAIGLAVFVLTGVTVQAQEPIDSIVIRKGTLFLGAIVPVCSQCGQYHKQGNCKTGLNIRPIDKSTPKIAESAGNRNRGSRQTAAESTQGTVQRPVSCVCNGKGCNYCSRSLDHATRQRGGRTSDIKVGKGRNNTTRQGADRSPRCWCLTCGRKHRISGRVCKATRGGSTDRRAATLGTRPTGRILSDVGGHLLIEASGIQKAGKGADRSRRVVRPVKVLRNRRTGNSFRDAGEQKNRKLSKRF
ncbi:MAG: hypothetical protein VX435_05985 [Planctomycetota bacterium]|nr:hypothetical protein [Planctomycetota bacterium]